MIKLTVEENNVLGGLIKGAGRSGVQTYFAAVNDDNSKRLSVMTRNNVNTLTEELIMLSEIVAGNVEIIHIYKPGDIVVRTKDWPFTLPGTEEFPEGRIFKIGDVSEDKHGVKYRSADGKKHMPSSIRPATEVEKKFFEAGRQRVEFKAGDIVFTKGGRVQTVEDYDYYTHSAMQDLTLGRITKVCLVENQIKFK